MKWAYLAGLVGGAVALLALYRVDGAPAPGAAPA